MRRPLPPKEIEFFPRSKLESKLVELQDQFKKFDKSIWGTDECERCGICCYKYEIEELGIEKQYTRCHNMEIVDSVPYCKIQEEKPEVCENYGCYKGRGSPVERWQMMQMAEKILKTKTHKDLEEVAKIHLMSYEEIDIIEKAKREEKFNQLSVEEQARI
ncbi:hypothetical protein KAS08_05665 [Candidatus Pacearchaeota archaeon]|nr:hypothetical protein [Candidatus Pacearchaeota archaeon]